MSKIKILPETLANQIAAGEVVERPASVVKEFLENSIDAGAVRIRVEVEGGGVRLIRVIDDGTGMDADDMLLCLERHATSKIKDEAQLAAINTLGFRGEAIPSIASVSRLTITSRLADAALGHQAHLRFGRLDKMHEMGCAPGTIMEVRDLFGNVPARRKFLKSSRTELAHINEVITSCALAYPTIGFTLTVDGRTMLSFAPQTESMEMRLEKVLGEGGRGRLIPVVEKRDELALSGYLLPPDEGGGAVGRLRTFVNLRPVRDRMIGHAAAEGMHSFLMKGRLPSGALLLALHPSLVDVNVHPAKQEIRFRNPAEVHRLVSESVARAMQHLQRQTRFSLFGTPRADGAAEARRPATGDTPPPVVQAAPVLPVKEASEPAVNLPLSFSPKARRETHGAALPPQVAVPAQGEPLRGDGGMGQHCREWRTEEEVADGRTPCRRFRYIGQFLDSYLLCEAEGGIAVIDQHAAHERLLFERLRSAYGARQLPAQKLLFPEMIDCTPAQLEILKQHGHEIRRLGVAVEEFGGGSYVVKTVPALLAHLGPREIMSGIFEHYLGCDAGKKATARQVDDILARMACRAAVKAHDQLRPEEGNDLLRQMEEADIFSHCPHGRPVVKFFSDEEIKKWFFR